MKQSPPDILFHSTQRLMVYRPRGILNEHRVNGIIAFLEKEEDAAETSFNRFTDLSKLDALNLDVNAMIRISLYRRLAYGNYPPVKSAFYVTNPDAARLIRVHVLLTDHSPIKARLFGEMQNAAKWLEVPAELLEQESPM
jgi:uncharacterized protein (DUF2384 family)